MDLGLKDKIIIVSGDACGISRDIAGVLTEEGSIVIHTGGKREDYLKWQKETEEKAIEGIVQRYGKIDGLVNTACMEPESGYGEEFSESLRDNLAHYYLMTHLVVPFLKISKGAIINVSSKTSESGQRNTQDYAAISGGCKALTREWAVELLKYGIRVNAVIVSKFLQENRMKKHLEIAHATAFLLSEKSSHTTGQLIYVDGGYLPS
jgi:L-fucose dehydrogenase